MNRYVFFAIVVLVGVGLDQWTKALALDELASRSTRWDHRIERVVETDGEPITVVDWIDATYGEGTSSLDPPEVSAIYLVRDGQEPLGPLSGSFQLADDATVQIGYRSVTIVEGFWNHVYVQNFGAAWGFLSQQNEKYVRPFFLIVSIFAVIIVISMFRKLRPDQKILLVALPLIVSGAVGNFIDRARFGYVVDFVDWYITKGGIEKHWPTFNVADVWITIGVALMIIEIIFGKDVAPDEPSDALADDDTAEAA
ncbi:MAG: lipoprotein signal peptidase [Bradymonadia bacterium]|jgi:lipoprotein signal peptidase